MFAHETILNRLRHGCQTMAYPDGPAPALPDRHGGALRVEATKCAEGCNACVPVCPTQAITRATGSLVALDLGRCIFCAACVEACPTHAITQTGDHRMAVRRRGDLPLGRPGEEELRLAAALDERLRKLFGRSLRLRQVSAGGCNACEADTNVLGTIGWDLGRFGIQFVASPRHADGLLITGPVSANMRLALEKTYTAVPAHQDCHCCRSMRHIGRAVRWSSASLERGGRGRAGGFVYSRLSAASADHFGRLAAVVGTHWRVVGLRESDGSSLNEFEFMKTMMRDLLNLQTLEFGETKKAGDLAVIAELRAKIPAQIIEHYDRLRARGKKGLAALKNQVCGSCHMQVPLGVVMTLRHGQDIQLCENCGRYLYLPEEEATVSTPSTPPPKAVRTPRRRKSKAQLV